MRLRFILILFTIFTYSSLWGQPLLLLDSEEKNKIGLYTSILEDPTTKLTLGSVIKSSKEFTPCKSEVFSTLKTSAAFWIKFNVKNLTDSNYFLVIDNPSINEIDFYVTELNKITYHRKLGNILPFNQRVIPKNIFILPVPLIKGRTSTIYIRYLSSWRTEIPISFLTNKKLIERSAIRDLWYGAFYGILIIVGIYTFFLYLIVRRKIFIYYLPMLIALGIFRSISHGFAFQYFFPNKPHFNNFFTYLFLSLLGILLIQFANKFLDTQKRTPVLHTIGNIICILAIMLFLVSQYDKTIWIYASLILIFIISTYVIVIGVSIISQGYKPAFYYLLGTVSYYFGMIITGIRTLGILPYSFFVYNLSDLGFAMEAILLSLALGDQYIRLEKEKKETLERLNKELQLKIAEKNEAQEELRKLNETLRNTNVDLDNFIYTASHELKAPVTNIEGLINLIESEPIKESTIKSMLDMMKDSVSKFKSTISNLVEVSKVQQMRGDHINENNIEKVIGIVSDKLKNKIQKSGAELNTNTQDCSTIKFSQKNLIRVIEQLIDNAIKFRSPERELIINIKTKEIPDFKVLCITDNGNGINSKNYDKIFSMFRKTKNVEEGRGIGLYIVKRIMENEGGKVEVKSEEKKGTTFSLYFKK